jgi:hypothetical protein
MRTEDPNPYVETGYTEVCFLGVHVVTTFVLFPLDKTQQQFKHTQKSTNGKEQRL